MVVFRYLYLIFVITIFTSICHGQEKSETDEIFNDKFEIYFRFENKDISFDRLTRIISIDSKTNQEWVYAYANKNEFTEFLNLKINYEILQHPGTLIIPKMRSDINIKNIDEWDFYPTYEAYIDLMYQFEQSYPDLCDVFSIGNSEEGRSLLFAKISKNVNSIESEPRFLYTSTMHGDETAGYVLMLHLIDHLLSNYGSDIKITHLLDNMEIWINPLANPDGTYAGGNNSIYGATRFNANGVDLNRNYPDPEDGDHPDGNPWQPETIEFMKLADSIAFLMGANFHSGAEVFNYPWDTWAQLHADDDWWQYVGREWADTVHKYGPPGYFTGFDNGITNGYEWYSISGGRQDYMNYFYHCHEVTLEISNTKILPESLLPDYWEYNYHSFLNYIEQALYGITGTVTDSITGDPLAASIFIEGHDVDGSWVKTDQLYGHYFRLLFEGMYQNITFSASGYESKTIDQVQVFNYQLTQQDVQLVYTGSGINNLSSGNIFSISPNPNSGTFRIEYMGSSEVNSKIDIYSLNGEIIFSQNYKFTKGSNYLPVELNKATHGVYMLKVQTDIRSFSEKIMVR